MERNLRLRNMLSGLMRSHRDWGCKFAEHAGHDRWARGKNDPTGTGTDLDTVLRCLDERNCLLCAERKHIGVFEGKN